MNNNKDMCPHTHITPRLGASIEPTTAKKKQGHANYANGLVNYVLMLKLL